MLQVWALSKGRVGGKWVEEPSKGAVSYTSSRAHLSDWQSLEGWTGLGVASTVSASKDLTPSQPRALWVNFIFRRWVNSGWE